MKLVLLSLSRVYFNSTFRAKCGPRLTPEASQKLRMFYQRMRLEAKELKKERTAAIPITARQLEALGEAAQTIRGVVLKNCYFGKTPKGGGGLPNPKLCMYLNDKRKEKN